MEAHQDATHVCTDCGKGFPSVKAYGGHRRIHVTAHHRAAESDVVSPDELPESSSGKNFELSESDVASSSTLPEKLELSVPCRVCKKSFPTEKALAGHMRCHPERKWRGINPPAESPTSSGEVWNFPASWGRKGIRRSQPSSDVEIATEALVEFSQCFRGDIIRVPAKNQSSGSDHVRLEEKKRKSHDDGGGDYKCSECERTFSSFQALGGHRSTHNKELHKNKKLKIKIEKSGDIAIDSGTDKNDSRLIVKSNEEPHQVLESSSRDKWVCDFDLNELPCDDIQGNEFGNTI